MGLPTAGVRPLLADGSKVESVFSILKIVEQLIHFYTYKNRERVNLIHRHHFMRRALHIYEDMLIRPTIWKFYPLTSYHFTCRSTYRACNNCFKFPCFLLTCQHYRWTWTGGWISALIQTTIITPTIDQSIKASDNIYINANVFLLFTLAWKNKTNDIWDFMTLTHQRKPCFRYLSIACVACKFLIPFVHYCSFNDYF